MYQYRKVTPDLIMTYWRAGWTNERIADRLGVKESEIIRAIKVNRPAAGTNGRVSTFIGLSEADKQKFDELYMAGIKYEDLAHEFDVGIDTVANWARLLEFPPRGKKIRGKSMRQKKSMSLSEVAKRAREAGMSYGKYVAAMGEGPCRSCDGHGCAGCVDDDH